MSAVTYSVDNLLEGKYYYSSSRRIDGIIQEAVPAPELWYDNAEAYKVRVRPTYEAGKMLQEDFWATVCVSQG